ncbi:hypothetical protein [Stigmatella aurantiaca]|uniref:hypothetical protein n=1 Tax=Stigmatella aurantiaca TaxID=41 RepID=UPI0012FBAA98
MQEEGEECDDGNEIDSDLCSNHCRAPRCGDGIKNRDEECDDAGETSTCDLDCTLPLCGDGNVNHNVGEQCDSGHPGEDTPACTKDCKVSFCGDEYVNRKANEECDTGVGGGRGCSATCKVMVCGNRKREAEEACDDGNTLSCGTCNSTCTEGWTLKTAEGHIKLLRPYGFVGDGWKFAIGAGGDVPVVFEFDRDGNAGSGTVKIDLGNNPTDEKIVERIKGAIESKQDAAGVTAALVPVSGGLSFVKLVSRKPGLAGNQLIGVDSAGGFSSTFEVVGLTGGLGKDCSKGVGCWSDDDCANGLSCKVRDGVNKCWD